MCRSSSLDHPKDKLSELILGHPFQQLPAPVLARPGHYRGSQLAAAARVVESNLQIICLLQPRLLSSGRWLPRACNS